jgi:sialidase-1
LPAPLTVYRSVDHGKTWQAQETVIHEDENGNVPSMHMAEHGITLRHGEHKGRLLRPARWFAGGDGSEHWPQHYNTAIYSDDGGKTWHTSDPFPALGTGEGAVAELSDGRIYYNSRRHVDPKGVDPYMRWTAWSYDGGETWKDLSISKVLPDGQRRGNRDGCMGGLVRLPVRGRDILLYSNCDDLVGRLPPSKRPENDTRDGGRGRIDVTVWASFDGGKTWPIKRRVFGGPSAYSSLFAGWPGTPSDGWIYILLEGGSKHRYDGAYMARFNLSWLLKGEKTGDGTLPDWL